MKIIRIKLISIVTIVLLLSQCIIPTIPSFADDVVNVTFQDENLYNKVKQSLSSKISNSDDNTLTISMTQENIDSVTQINATGTNTNYIENITGLENFTNLTRLTLYHNHISDITPLGNLTNLTYLDLSSNNIENLQPLSGLTSLTTLSLRGNKIENITALNSLTSLEKLYLGETSHTISSTSYTKTQTPGSNMINDISALRSLTNLTELALGYNQITNIDTLGSLVNLEQLYLSKNNIETISALASLSNLEYLQLEDNDITDISPLQNLTNLRSLDVSNNNITNFSHISNLNNLKNLDISNQETNITDTSTSFLSGLANLEALDIKNVGITNISGMQNLTNLQVLELGSGSYATNNSGSYWNYGNEWSRSDDAGYSYVVHVDEKNNITNIESLQNLSHLKVLFMDAIGINNISSISGLNSLEHLSIKCNNISDLTPIMGLNNLKSVFADKNNIESIQGISSMTNIKMLSLIENKIENASEIDELINTYCRMQRQNITRNIENTNSVQLPDVFIRSKNSESTLYSAENFVLNKCTLSNDGTSVIINDGENEASIKIYKGKASGSTLNITRTYVAPLAAVVSYSPMNITNQDVVVTITANKKIQEVEGWSLSEDETKLTKTFTANGTETVTVYDLDGNDSTVNVSVTNIDKIAPEVSVGYNTTNITNQDVVATITANEKIQEVEGWRLSEDGTKLTKTFTTNGTESVTVYDLAGNNSIINVSVTNIDKTAPGATIVYSTTTKTNQDVVATITANEKIQEVEGWRLSEDETKLTKTFTANGTESVTVSDLAGNNSTINVSVTNIDKIAPEVSVSYNPTTKTNQDVVATITANEKIQEIEGWRLSEDETKLTKTFTTNSTEAVTVYDLAGNNSIANLEVNNIDKGEIVLVVGYSTTKKTNKDVIVIITANKKIQEIEGWTLSEDKTKLTKTFTTNGTEEVTAYDLAGNNSTIDVSVNNIDKIAPETLVSYSITKNTNKDVVVTITADEEIQEVEGWTLSEDETKLTKTYTINGEEAVIVYDLAGNSSSVNVKVSNIDKKAPVVEVDYSTTKKTNEDVIVTIVADEEIQEVEGWTLSEDKTKLTKTYKQNGAEKIKVYDVVGNYTEVEISVDNIIDETASPNGLPNTGIRPIIILIMAFILITVIMYKKNKDLRDIK